MDRLTYLVLGASGQVGTRLVATLHDHVALYSSSRHGGTHPCDLSDEKVVTSLLEHLRPDVVVNAAAYTAVDRAETESEVAHAINADLPRTLGHWACRHDAAVLHYSTDYVFDGQARRPYRESDPTHPLGIYGTTKLAGEVALRDSGCDHLILRTAWVYDIRGQNFLRTMLRLAASHPSIRVVDDQHGTPTSAPFIAQASWQAMTRWLSSESSRRELSGTYHLTADGETTWAGFAEAIFSRACARGLLANAPQVVRIPSREYPTPAARPAWSVLDTLLIRERFGVTCPNWHDDLDDTLAPSVGH